MKYIGITETGDPAFVKGWDNRLLEANIIISKELTDDMIEKLVNNQSRIIFHHTVTGLGGTIYEPNVPSKVTQLNQAIKLFGFPKSHYVLRIDPIIPFNELLINNHLGVLDDWTSFTKESKLRCRISIIDMYNHVLSRFRSASIPTPTEDFQLNNDYFSNVAHALANYSNNYDFESCAEPKFSNLSFITNKGCASNDDLLILGLDPSEYGFPTNPQRKTCNCLSKKQILGIRPGRCSHNCLYCFWK